MAKKKRTPTPRQVFGQAIEQSDHLQLQNGLTAIKRSEGKGRIIADDPRRVLGSSNIDDDCRQAAPGANRHARPGSWR